MNSILSIFETAVADYLMLASVMAVVLVPAAWGLVKIEIVKNSVNRHMVWLFTLLAIALLPAIWLHGPKLPLAVLSAQNNSVENVSQPDNIDFTAVQISKADESSSFRPPMIITLLVWGWGFGFLLMLIRLAVGGFNLRRLLRTAEPGHDITGIEDGGRRGAQLLLSQEVDCPVCFGLRRPVILMPKQMYNEIGPEDFKMILRHEVAHIERKDCWVNSFQRSIEAMLFFHPLVWYASFQLTQQREELCDLHVIADGEPAENYVELLTRIAREGFEKRAVQAMALFEGRLLSRVQRLLRLDGEVRIRASRKAVWVFAVTAMLCLAAGSVRLEAQSETVLVDKGVSSTSQDSFSEIDVPNNITFRKVYEPKYADAEDLAEVLQNILKEAYSSSGGNKENEPVSSEIIITSDKASNRLLVMAENSTDGLVLGQIIERLDVPFRKAAIHHINLDRTQVYYATENLTDLMAQAGFKLYNENDLNGLQVTDIMPNSFFKKMGLQVGDILTAAGGRPLTTDKQAGSFFESLKFSDAASMEINRGGRLISMEYQIQ